MIGKEEKEETDKKEEEDWKLREIRNE